MTNIAGAKWLMSALFLLLLTGNVYSQGGSPLYGDGLTIRFDSAGQKYIRFSTYATFWLRYTRANPGTSINGIQKKGWSDISLREFRFAAYAQLNPRYLILVNIGVDNQAFSSGGQPGGGNTGNGGETFAGTLGKKPGLFLHDLWNEYAVVEDIDHRKGRPRWFSLYVGTGLHYWLGISRLTSANSANYLAIDAPIYNWPLADQSDQYARQLGIYLKGHAGPVNYRWSVNKPFTVINPIVQYPEGRADSGWAVDNNVTGKLSTSGYADWQFFEKENDLLPYTTGTYVGTRRVLNVGGGYYYAGEATTTQASNVANSAVIRHAISLWAVDCFADIPLGPAAVNWAVTGYSAFYHYGFGPGYLRYEGIMNPATGMAAGYGGKVSEAGFGNLAPVTGTGTSWYTQAGVLLPKTVTRNIRWQPFGEFSRQTFDRFGAAVFTWWGAGSNVYLDGHHARLSFKYQTRPLIEGNRQSESKWACIIATQVFL